MNIKRIISVLLVIILIIILTTCNTKEEKLNDMDAILLERWKDRLAFVGLGAEEILYFTQEDFDAMAKKYKDLGLTHILFSSPFHCRISYHPYWDDILKAMGMFINSIHKYGMKAVEHFSVVVPHNIGDTLIVAHGTERMYQFLPGLEALITDDNGAIDGIRVNSFYQIDGSTGKPFFNPMYKSYSLCVNNTDYRKILFKHLEDIYALGVDGIMTDDLEKYSINACACIHCRALFREMYGYDLPETENWRKFAGDYSNSMYIDWLRFRHETSKQFQYEVNAHYESLGMKDMVRPNYVSSCLLSNFAAYPFEAAAELWTHTFAENVWGMKTGHLTFACEGIHRTAMGERNNSASLAMMYPHNDPEIYFSYANAWCWGQSYLGAGVGEINRLFINYETTHWDSLFAAQKNSDLAVYFSTDTRDYTEDSEMKYQRPLVAWMQAAYTSGLNLDMVFQDDSVEILRWHDVILVSHVAMVSKAQLEILCAYVYSGGKLIIVGPFGVFDESGKPQDAYQAFDLDIEIKRISAGRRTLSFNDKTIPNAHVNSCVIGGGQPVITDNNGNVIAVSCEYGEGELVIMPSSMVGDWYQEPVLFYYLTPDEPGGPPMADAPAYVVQNLRDTAGVFLKEVLGTQVVDIQIDNPDILGFSHTGSAGNIHSIKLLNIADTFVKEQRRYSDTEDMEHFHMDSVKISYPIEVSVEIVNNIKPKTVVLSTPEHLNETVEIPVTEKNGRLYFTVPENYFSGFALIELK